MLRAIHAFFYVSRNFAAPTRTGAPRRTGKPAILRTHPGRGKFRPLALATFPYPRVRNERYAL